MPTKLTPQEKSRYSRHILLDDVGLEGQLKLKAARILIIGLGGLGNPAAAYLAASGIGHLGLLDADVVSMTNLHRQVLFQEADVGKSKVSIGALRLKAINPHIECVTMEENFTQESGESIAKCYDIILDCTDNFQTRYAINSISFRLGIPFIHGSIYRFEGQVSVLNDQGGPCYRCIYPNPPPQGALPNCATAGVLGVLPATIGALQATEALKIILGLGQPLRGRLLTYDALNTSFQTLTIHKDPECPMCKQGLEVDTSSFASCELPALNKKEVEWQEISKDWAGKEYCLIDIRSKGERDIIHIPNSVHVPSNLLLESPKHFVRKAHSAQIILYCKSGARSNRVVAALQSMGFGNFSSLKGGVLAWRKTCKNSEAVY